MIDLEKLVSGDLAPVWLIHGDARPLVQDAVAKVVARALEQCAIPAFNHSTSSAAEGDPAAALATARTLPMMSDLRVVEVRDMQEGSDQLFEALLAYAADPSPSTVLVVTGSGFPKVRKGGRSWARKVETAVKKAGRVVKISSRDMPAGRFAVDRAKALGKRLGRREAELLVEIVGDDLGRLAREVDKVALFVGDAGEITADDLHMACSLVAESVIWDLTAGIAARDPDGALASLHRQLEEGEDPRKLLGMIAWQLRQVLQAAELIRAGASDGEIRTATRMRFDLLRSLRRSVEAGRTAGAARMMGRLAHANRQMNEHRAGDRRILESLVLDLCAG